MKITPSRVPRRHTTRQGLRTPSDAMTSLNRSGSPKGLEASSMAPRSVRLRTVQSSVPTPKSTVPVLNVRFRCLARCSLMRPQFGCETFQNRKGPSPCACGTCQTRGRPYGDTCPDSMRCFFIAQGSGFPRPRHFAAGGAPSMPPIGDPSFPTVEALRTAFRVGAWRSDPGARGGGGTQGPRRGIVGATPQIQRSTGTPVSVGCTGSLTLTQMNEGNLLANDQPWTAGARNPQVLKHKSGRQFLLDPMRLLSAP